MKFIPIIFLMFFISCKKNYEFDYIMAEPINLIDTKWSIVESKEIESITRDGIKYPIIWFTSDGFSVNSSCNYMAGKIKMTSYSFTYESLGGTLLHCNDQQFKIEGYFSELRNTNILYKFSNGILYLFKGDKMMGSFKRID